jgi:hypothetical protein
MPVMELAEIRSDRCLFVREHYAKKTYGGVTSGEIAPGAHWIVGWVGLRAGGEEKNLAPARN